MVRSCSWKYLSPQLFKVESSSLFYVHMGELCMDVVYVSGGMGGCQYTYTCEKIKAAEVSVGYTFC